MESLRDFVLGVATAAVAAIACPCLGGVATGAEELKSVREAVLDGPFVHPASGSSDFSPVGSSVPFDVIQFERVGIIFPATRATAAVAADHGLSYLPSPFGFVVHTNSTSRFPGDWFLPAAAAQSDGAPSKFSGLATGGTAGARFFARSRHGASAEAKSCRGFLATALSRNPDEACSAVWAALATGQCLATAVAQSDGPALSGTLTHPSQTDRTHFSAWIGDPPASVAESGRQAAAPFGSGADRIGLAHGCAPDSVVMGRAGGTLTRLVGPFILGGSSREATSVAGRCA